MSAAELGTLAVMVPAYGDTDHLREAVSSVVGQDCPDWTLTVLDDGPPAPALTTWCAGLGERVHYQRNDQRLGLNRNFQQCLDLAGGDAEDAGDLVVVMGADDRMRPNYARTVLTAAAATPQAAFFQPGVQVIDAQGKSATPLADRLKRAIAIRGPALVGGEELAVSLLRGNWMYFPSVSFRTRAARRFGFREGLDLTLDLDLYLRMLLSGERLYVLAPVCFEYRRHEQSLSASERLTGIRFAEERTYFAEVADTMSAAGWTRAARAARWHTTSRLHAGALLPGALVRRDGTLVRTLGAHLLRP